MAASRPLHVLVSGGARRESAHPVQPMTPEPYVGGATLQDVPR